MTPYRKLASELRMIKDLVLKPKTLTEEEKKIKETDTPLVRRIKMSFQLEIGNKDGILTSEDIKKMHNDQKAIYDFFNRSHLIKDADKKKDINFKLRCIERGIGSLEEDLDHNKTNGRKMKEGIEDLEKAIRTGKLSEMEMKEGVGELTNLIKRKESDYQKAIKTKESDWKELWNKYNEVVKKWEADNQLLINLREETSNLEEQIKKEKEQEKQDEEKIRNLQQQLTEKSLQISVESSITEKLRDEIKNLENIVKDKEQLNLEMCNETKKWEVQQKQMVGERKRLSEAMSNMLGSSITSSDLLSELEKIKNKLNDDNLKISERDKFLSQLNIYRSNTIFELNCSNFEKNASTYLDMLNQGLHTEDCLVLTSNYEPQQSSSREYSVDLTSFSYNRPFIWIHSLLGEYELKSTWNITLIKVEESKWTWGSRVVSWNEEFILERNGGYIIDTSIVSHAKAGRLFANRIAHSSFAKKVHLVKKAKEVRRILPGYTPNSSADRIQCRAVELSFSV